MRWWWLVVCWLGIGLGCTGGSGSGDGGLDGGVDAEVPAPGDPGTYLAVTLRRGADGAIALVDAQAIERAEPPLLTTSGELLALAWGGGEVLDSAFVSWPQQLRGEGPEAPFEVELPVEGEVTATIDFFAGRPIERVTVHDAAGVQVADLVVPAEPPALTEAEAWMPLPEAPWLAVVRPSAVLSLLPAAVQSNVASVIDPITEMSDAQRERLASALRLATPDTLAAARYVVVASFGPRVSGLLGFAVGSTLVVRADLIEGEGRTLEFTAVHELAHVFDTFLGLSGSPQDVDAFLAGLDVEAANVARRHIQDRVRRRRFDRPLTQIFGELMGVARGQGLTEETYCGRLEPAACWLGKDERAYAAGAAIPYGVATLAEDVASWVHTVHALAETQVSMAHLCSEMAAAPDIRQRGHLLAYAKLAVLRGVGAITEADFDACVGAFPIPRPQQPGIYLHRGDEVFAMPMAVQAGWSNVLGFPMFSVLAGTGDGQYRGLIQVQAPTQLRFPSRMIALADINAVTVGMPLSGFFLSHETELGRARASRSGLVLFTELSTERVEGVILFLELQSDLFVVTDTFEVGTFLWTP